MEKKKKICCTAYGKDYFNTKNDSEKNNDMILIVVCSDHK